MKAIHASGRGWWIWIAWFWRRVESRFAAFIGSLNDVIGHRDRIGPFRDYCAGLLAGCERKSVEPLAAITAPSRVSAQHQSLLHFVAAAGAAFTTTPRSASPPTPSSSWNARRFPPQDLLPQGSAKKLKFPKVTSQEDMPLRPERHIPNSIATLKRRIAAALARSLPRCPCCGGAKQIPAYRPRL